jgi:hypothetical protein
MDGFNFDRDNGALWVLGGAVLLAGAVAVNEARTTGSPARSPGRTPRKKKASSKRKRRGGGGNPAALAAWRQFQAAGRAQGWSKARISREWKKRKR